MPDMVRLGHHVEIIKHVTHFAGNGSKRAKRPTSCESSPAWHYWSFGSARLLCRKVSPLNKEQSYLLPPLPFRAVETVLARVMPAKGLDTPDSA